MPGPKETKESIDFLDYMEIILKRWRMISAVTAIAFIFSIIYSLQMPKIYSSTACIIPPQQDSGIVGMLGVLTGGMSGVAGDLLGRGTTADLYVGILKSESIRNAIIDRFDLMKHYKMKYRLYAHETLINKATITTGKRDGIISITVENNDPKLAADMANAFVEELGKFTINLNTAGAEQNRGFLEERLSLAKSELSSAENNIKNFQKKHKLLDVPQQTKVTIEGIAQLRAQLATQEVKLATLKSQFTDSSQEVKTLKTSCDNLRMQVSRLEGVSDGGSIPSIGTIPLLGQEYMRLMRDFKAQEAIFEALTKQNEVLKLSGAKNVSSVQILQKATVPDKEIKPKKRVVVIVSTIIAFLFSIFMSFFLKFLSAIQKEDIEKFKKLFR